MSTMTPQHKAEQAQQRRREDDRRRAAERAKQRKTEIAAQKAEQARRKAARQSYNRQAYLCQASLRSAETELKQTTKQLGECIARLQAHAKRYEVAKHKADSAAAAVERAQQQPIVLANFVATQSSIVSAERAIEDRELQAIGVRLQLHLSNAEAALIKSRAQVADLHRQFLRMGVRPPSLFGQNQKEFHGLTPGQLYSRKQISGIRATLADVYDPADLRRLGLKQPSPWLKVVVVLLAVPFVLQTASQVPGLSIPSVGDVIHQVQGNQAPSHKPQTQKVPVIPGQPTAYAKQQIPAPMIAKFQQAAAVCPGLPWGVVAGNAKIESGMGTFGGTQVNLATGASSKKIIGPRLDGSPGFANINDTDHGILDGDPVKDRAVGPLQFIPSTWAVYGADGNGDGVKSPFNFYDQMFAAAKLYCGSQNSIVPYQSRIYRAIFGYNHSDSYVANVLKYARKYAGPTLGLSLNQVDYFAPQVAKLQLGEPYSWGGGTAAGPTKGICCTPLGFSGTSIRGFDCSGLMEYAYGQMGIKLPSTASAQYLAGKKLGRLNVSHLKRGDMVYFANNLSDPSTIHHVAMYIGNGKIVEAPRPGTHVRISDMSYTGYIGATRPA